MVKKLNYAEGHFMYKYIMLTIVVIVGTIAVADTKTADKNTQFSESSAKTSITLVKESLNSFKAIVKAATNEEPIILKEYKHTSWEMLNIGIPNNLRIIEGTLLKQHFINAKLRYELYLAKKKNNLSDDKKSIYLEKKYIETKKKYDFYLKNTKSID